MANEGSIRASVAMTKGLVSRSVDTGTVKYDISEAAAEGPKTLALTSSFASLTKGSVTTPKWVLIENVHATKAAIVSLDGGTTSPITIPANGFPCLIPLTSTFTFSDLQAKVASDTGSIDYAVLP